MKHQSTCRTNVILIEARNTIVTTSARMHKNALDEHTKKLFQLVSVSNQNRLNLDVLVLLFIFLVHFFCELLMISLKRKKW